MPIAVILAMCALALSPGALAMPLMGAPPLMHALESPQNSATGQSAEPPAADLLKNPDQPVSPQQTPASAPCGESAQPGSTTHPPCTPAPPTVAKIKKHGRAKKVAAPPAAGPTKTVVRNGGTADPTVQLAQSLDQQQASRELRTTNQLLATSDANLKKIAGRQLSASQQDTVGQIKTYMLQAKAAANSGDLQRAHNLAFKANLLSAELAGH
jgi:hypothetical protein